MRDQEEHAWQPRRQCDECRKSSSCWPLQSSPALSIRCEHPCLSLQGPNQLVWCLPTGGYDPRKHGSYEACARSELSEEARLAGGTWELLVPEGHPGIAEVKWCRWAGCAQARGTGGTPRA